MLCSLYPAYTQTNSLKQERNVYCELTWDRSSHYVYLDFDRDGYRNVRTKIVDSTGCKIRFSTFDEITEYMNNRGWQLKNSYSSHLGANVICTYLVFEKTMKNNEYKYEGILCKKDFKKGKRK